MSDAAPWEDYAPGSGPWADYQSPAPPVPQGGVMGAFKGASRALEANLPFVDRAVAAAKGGDYASNLANEQAKNAQFAQDNPWTNTAGGLAALSASSGLFAAAPALDEGFGLSGRVASTMWPAGIYGALQGVSSSPDLTNVKDTANRGVIGGMEGAALGAAAPIVGAGIGRAISPLASALRGPGAADVAALGASKDAAYKNVEDLGAAYSPAQVQALAEKIASDAKSELINPKLNAKASATIESLQQMAADKAETGQSLTLPELDTWRQYVNDNLLSGMPEGKQARFGQIIKGNIDDFIKQAEPHAMEPRAAPAAPNYNPPVGPDENVPPGSPSQPGRPLPSNLKRNLDRQGDYHAQVRDLYDLAVEHGIVRSRLQFDNPSETQANQIQDLYNQYKVPRWSPNFRDPNNLNLPDQWPISQPANYPTGGENAALRLPPRGSGPAPVPMLDVMRRYGLQDEGGDLASMGFANKTGVASKGALKIIDKAGGVPMDEGLRVAKELGYMEPNDTVADFINKLSDHPTYSRADQEEVAKRAARSEFDLGMSPQGELSNPANYEQSTLFGHSKLDEAIANAHASYLERARARGFDPDADMRPPSQDEAVVPAPTAPSMGPSVSPAQVPPAPSAANAHEANYVSSRPSQVSELTSGEQASGLVVARRMPNGSVLYGGPENIHADLMGDVGSDLWKTPFSPEDMGFARQGGPFMSRDQAAGWLDENEPEGAARRADFKAQMAAKGITEKPFAPAPIPQAPSAADASAAIQTARDLAKRQFKVKALADALNKSQISADTSGSGGNIENATRSRLGRILTQEPWSEDETDQLNKMIHGTVATNLLRPASRFNPFGNPLMAALELASGHGALKAAGGIAGSTGSNIARRAGLNKMMATILAGGKAPVSPSYSAGPTRAAFAAALAARQQLPRQENTPQ